MNSRHLEIGVTSKAKLACSGVSDTPMYEDSAHPRVYSFTGLTPEQTKALAEKAHIYMTADGRISMAGLNSQNVGYFAESVDKAVRGQL
jgi:hypothetical protein